MSSYSMNFAPIAIRVSKLVRTLQGRTGKRMDITLRERKSALSDDTITYDNQGCNNLYIRGLEL